jgi:hypothetical protein
MIDVDGVPRLVDARWFDDHDGWIVYADDASDSYPWDDENQLFSGNSRIPSAA